MALRDWPKILLPPSIRELIGYSAEPHALVGGNTLQLLHGGKEAYPEMLLAILQAKVTVNLETYILRDDHTGWRFARAMADASRRGVQCKLIYDAVGSMGLSDRFIQFLRNHGIGVVEYRPLAPWRRRWAWDLRNHRKILIVDGKIGFAGGINIADEYAAVEDEGEGWLDFHVKVVGPAAYDLDRLFRKVWYRETGKWFYSAGDPAARPGKAFVRVAANDEFVKRFLIRRDCMHAVERAKKRVLIANAYFIPDRGIRKYLIAAAKRGADVRVLVPSFSDVPATAYASRHLYERLMKKGIRLFAWPRNVLHAKVMSVDGSWCAVGSYNFTHRSLHHNLEVNLHILDKPFARNLEQAILADMKESTELTLEVWRRRPYHEKMLERLCYLLRVWF